MKKKKKGNTSQTKSISNSENILGIECVVNLSVVISTMKYLGIEMFLFSFLSDVNLLFTVSCFTGYCERSASDNSLPK